MGDEDSADLRQLEACPHNLSRDTGTCIDQVGCTVDYQQIGRLGAEAAYVRAAGGAKQDEARGVRGRLCRRLRGHDAARHEQRACQPPR